uniref:Predicted gene, 17651 n=1 Tax=Mus spicilegus TaxID=10103 RepID=A0A8C6HV41_MUSSI
KKYVPTSLYKSV